MPWTTLLLILATGGLLGTGCSGDAASEADLATADTVVTAEDMAFVDPPAALPAGTQLLGLDNRDRARHDITVDGIGTIAKAGGGGSDVGEVTLEPGTYTLYCDVGGHRDAGMEFTVTVR